MLCETIYLPTSADQAAVTDAPFLSRRKVSKREVTQNAIFQVFYSQQRVKDNEGELGLQDDICWLLLLSPTPAQFVLTLVPIFSPSGFPLLAKTDPVL